MKRLAILFGLFIIAVIVLADLGMLDILGAINRIPFGDKAGHFILYGILTLLIDLTLFRSHPLESRKLVAVKCGLILAILIGLEEYSQRFFAERTPDLVDLLFSWLGVAFFSWLALRIK